MPKVARNDITRQTALRLTYRNTLFFMMYQPIAICASACRADHPQKMTQLPNTELRIRLLGCLNHIEREKAKHNQEEKYPFVAPGYHFGCRKLVRYFSIPLASGTYIGHQNRNNQQTASLCRWTHGQALLVMLAIAVYY